MFSNGRRGHCIAGSGNSLILGRRGGDKETAPTLPGRLENAQAWKLARIRDDHLPVASVLSLTRSAREKPEPGATPRAWEWGAEMRDDHRSASLKCSGCEVFLHRRLPQVTSTAASPAAPPAPAPAVAALNRLVAAAAAGSKPGPSFQP